MFHVIVAPVSGHVAAGGVYPAGGWQNHLHWTGAADPVAVAAAVEVAGAVAAVAG
jgi:hypothetical protein